MWFVTLWLGVAVIWLINHWVKSISKNWEKRGIPHSSSSPFTYFAQYLFTKRGLMDIQNERYNELAGHSFGGFFQIFTPSIMVRDPELVYKICVKDFSYFSDRNAPSSVSDLFTETLVNQTGDKWRTLRHKMTPTFTSGKLMMMFTPIKECCDEVVMFIEKKLGQDIEARDFMFKFVVNVIGSISFGLKVDALNEETEKDNEFLNISKSFFKPSFMLMLKFMVTTTMPKLRHFIKFSLIDDKTDKFFRELVKNMIVHREKTGEIRNDFLQLLLEHKRKEQPLSSVNNDNVTKINSFQNVSEEPEDKELLDQLTYMQKDHDTNNKDVFTDDCIAAQTFNFISGGSEATATTICFVLYELAANPKLQKKVQNEVDDILSKNEFDYQATKKLKYVEQFINETIRLHSIFPFLNRVCSQDYKVPGTDVILEKGSYLTIPIPCIQKDPDFFPDPERFDPDRFGDKNEIPQGTFLGFGCGPRMCIAKRLAMLQMKILVATVMQNFNVTLSKKTQLPLRIQKSSVFHHVIGGVWIQFERRT